MIQQGGCSMVIKVRCPNQGCGETTHLCDDGLRRVFRCPRCRTKLPRSLSTTRGRDGGACTVAPPLPPLDFEDELEFAHRGVTTAEEPALAGAPDLGSSSRLGRLQLRDKLGSGSFATIYHAFDPLLERDVSLKVFHTPAREWECSRDIDHFATEAKALARLRHPRIVPIYDAGREGEYHYIAMEFIEGRTLAEALLDGPTDVRQAATIIADLAEALAYAHGNGVVHRDIKPSNIVLDARGVAHLIDFGLAHRRGMADDPTRAGAIQGTPAYLAPEQAKGNDAVPHPSNDQYSLGVVLYELLCGQTPFSGPPLLVLVSTLQAEPPRPRTLNPDVPPGLEAICLKTLAKSPEDRYPSCQSLADDVRRWLRGEPTLVNPPEPRARGWSLRWVRQIREVAATFLAMLVLFVMTSMGLPKSGL
jgi:serine/threonine protein kinase